MNLSWIPRRPREEQSHEVSPSGMAHTTPTVVSAAATALLKNWLLAIWLLHSISILTTVGTTEYLLFLLYMFQYEFKRFQQTRAVLFITDTSY